MDCPDVPRVESSSKAPAHLRVYICFFPYLPKVILGPDDSSIFCRSFSKVCGGFLVKYCAVGPGRSPFIIASITISFGTIGVWALRRRNLRTYACRYSSWSRVHWNRSWAVTGFVWKLVTSMSFSFCHDVIVPGQREEYHV
jgi:hypothetical protein